MIGSIFATAGLAVLLVLKYALNVEVPEVVTTSFYLGLGVVLLGSLTIYAIPKKDK